MYDDGSYIPGHRWWWIQSDGNLGGCFTARTLPIDFTELNKWCIENGIDTPWTEDVELEYSVPVALGGGENVNNVNNEELKMEIVTLEYVIKYGEKKECVVLYFKDKESAEKYKREIEDDPNITFEDDAIGYQYYNAGEWYSEINDMIINQAWGRLNPPVAPGTERVVERVVERDPEFYKVRYTNRNNNTIVCKLLRSEDEMKDYIVKALNVTVSLVTVVKMSLDQLVEEYENA